MAAIFFIRSHTCTREGIIDLNSRERAPQNVSPYRKNQSTSVSDRSRAEAERKRGATSSLVEDSVTVPEEQIAEYLNENRVGRMHNAATLYPATRHETHENDEDSEKAGIDHRFTNIQSNPIREPKKRSSQCPQTSP